MGVFDTIEAAIPAAPGAPVVSPQDRANPFTSIEQAATDADTARLNAVMSEAGRVDPERYIQATTIANRIGVSPDAALGNFDQLSQAEANERARNVLEQNPNIAEWYALADNSKTVKVDELKKLSGVSWLAGMAGQAYTDGAEDVRLSRLRYAQLDGSATPEMISAADTLSKKQQAEGERTFGADSWLQQGTVGFVKNAPYMLATMAAAFKGSQVGGVAGAAIGAVGGLGILSAPSAGTGYLAGMAVGGVYGAYSETMKLEAGGAYEEFKRFKTDDGRVLNDKVARNAALVVGNINGALEVLGLRYTVGAIPGVRDVMNVASREGMKTALQNKTVMSALQRYGVGVGTGIFAESAIESAQELTTIAAGQIAKQLDGGKFEPVTVAEMSERIAKAFTDTAKMMLVSGPFYNAPRLMKDIGGARRASQVEQVFKGIAENANENSAFIDRDPARAKEAFDAAAKDTGFNAFYVPSAVATELYQSFPELGNVIPGFVDQVRESQNTNSDVRIETGDFYAHIARTDLGEKILPHVKLAPDGLTIDQAKQFNEAWTETQEAMLADEVAAAKQEREKAGPEAAVYDDVREKSIAAGNAPDIANQHAALFQSFFKTLADKTGEKADELYRSYGVQIRRDIPDAVPYKSRDRMDLVLDAIRAGKQGQADLALRRAKGKSLLAFIRDRGGLVETGGELKAMDATHLAARIDAQTGRVVDRRGRAIGGGITPEKLGLDATATAAQEAGYFDLVGVAEGAAGPNDLLDAISRELAGDPLYSPQQEQEPEQFAASIAATAQMLEELGLDPNSPNETLRAAIAAAAVSAPQEGDLFQMAGRYARGIDTPALHQAFAMQRKGATPTEIWEATGFFRGVDNKWRFEISDRDATVDVDALSSNLMETPKIDWEAKKPRFYYDGPLGELLDHPKLYAAYPRLSDFRVVVEPAPAGELSLGGYTSDRIRVYSNELKDFKSTLLHEIAHAIQDIEGFAFGGNVSMGEIYEGSRVEAVRAELAQVSAALEDALWTISEGGTDNKIKAYRDRAEKLSAEYDIAQKRLVKTAQYEYYRRLAGEVEARNVQSRAEFGKEHAADVHPFYSQDVPNGQQIIPVRSEIGPAFDVAALSEDQPNVQEFLQTKRGSIQIAPGSTIINLFERADLSTFLHETGHFFLEVTRDLATKSNAPAGLVEDWQKIKTSLGITDDAKIEVEAHEKFARSFEAYLFEGKAPSEATRGLFARFRTWLLFVYGQVAKLGVTVSPELRGVFDRMLASDAEINAAQGNPEFTPLFSSAADAGMTQPEFEDYNRLAQSAVDAAKADFISRSLSAVKREQSRAWRDAKAAVRREVEAELAKIPVYQATAFMRDGTMPDGSKAATKLRMSREAVIELYGEGILPRLPRYVPPIVTKTGGVHPDVIAEMFGFKSGHDLLTELISAPPLATATRDEVNARMKEQHGDLLGNQATAAVDAVGALHNDERGLFVETELKALAKKAGIAGQPAPRKFASNAAKQIIGAKKIADAVRVGTYQQAESKAARDAEKAILKGDYRAAAEAKRRQLFNHYLAMEAARARDEVDAAVRYLSKYTGTKKPAGIDPDYFDQIAGMLERLDMRKISGPESARRKALAEFIEEQTAAGNSVDGIPEALRDAAFKMNYRDMNVDELRGVRDAVQNIEHLGRLKNKIILKRREAEFGRARDEVVTQIETHRARKPRNNNRNPSRLDKFYETIGGADASLLKIEQLISQMDNGDINGPLYTNIFRPIADAQVRENDLNASVTARIEGVMERFEPGYLSERVTVREVNTTFTRGEMLAVALNTGSQSNLDKMLKGEGWSQSQLDAVTNNLNERDWRAVQDILNIVNSLWPEMSAVERRMTGTTPVKVEAQPMVTPHGTFDGGYFPMKYDPRRSYDVEQRAGNALMESQNSYRAAGVKRGFTKARVEGYGRPILFDLSTVGSHIADVVHFITHREAIRDVNKIINDGAVITALESRVGRNVRQQLQPWLHEIGNGDKRPENMDSFERAALKSRTNMSVFALGFSVLTGTSQLVGFTASQARLTGKWLSVGLKQAMRNPNAARAFVFARSGEMRHRQSSMDTDVRAAIMKHAAARPGVRGGVGATYRAAQRFAFYGIAFMDNVVSIPTWLGAYHKHLSEHLSDEGGAIQAGDRAVRLTQGTGAKKDIAAVSRGTVAKLLNPFYTPFSALYNEMRDTTRQAREVESGADVAYLLARAWWMVAVPAVLGELLTGKYPGDDGKEESVALWIARKVALYPLLALPGIRSLVSALDSGFAVQLDPLSRVLDTTGKLLKEISHVGSDKASARKLVTHTIDTVGLGFGVPVRQANVAVNNFWRFLAEGNPRWLDLVKKRPESDKDRK